LGSSGLADFWRTRDEIADFIIFGPLTWASDGDRLSVKIPYEGKKWLGKRSSHVQTMIGIDGQFPAPYMVEGDLQPLTVEPTPERYVCLPTRRSDSRPKWGALLTPQQ
jgi:hypothetical protein